MESKRYKIMLVDDELTELTIGKNMLKDHFEVFTIPSGERLFEVLSHVEADLILLDIVMPQMDGYETLTRLKANPELAAIPVIFVTARNDETSEIKGLELGAIDYVTKPFSAPLLVKRLQNHLLLNVQKKELEQYNTNLQETVDRKTRQVVDLQNAILSSMADMLEARDSVTGSHATRTQKYLELLVRQLIKDNIYHSEISKWDLDFLFLSAQLHDIGKIAISDAILNKPGKLTEEEFDEIKRHTTAGVDALKRIAQKTEEHAFLRHARIIAGSHHERWNGSGYPVGLAGDAIPLEGRLMAIADVYDALISRRPYKLPLSSSEAAVIIMEGKGSHFDPVLVDTFSKVTNHFAEIASTCL
jgi:putative two-component system response regulator